MLGFDLLCLSGVSSRFSRLDLVSFVTGFCFLFAQYVWFLTNLELGVGAGR